MLKAEIDGIDGIDGIVVIEAASAEPIRSDPIDYLIVCIKPTPASCAWNEPKLRSIKGVVFVTSTTL